MFPACAGMNRVPWGYVTPIFRVPRVRGDEPGVSVKGAVRCQCSPRARG